MHQQVGYGSLYGFFSNPAAQVSAQFWIGQDGTIEQYVDTERAAWHACDLNVSYCGIEFEGLETDPITAEQVEAGGALLADGKRIHGWPLVQCNSKGESGFGFHRLPGSQNSTACPSDLRLSARPAILDVASGAAPSSPPSSAPPAAAAKPPPPKPGTDAPPWPGRYFEYPPGVIGDDVRQWQAQMAARGWGLVADSQYGPASRDACHAFQAEKGLGADGIVGPETWAATWTAPIT